MKKLAAIIIFSALFLALSTPALAVKPNYLLDRVDIGDATSEVGHHLFGWGPVEPSTHSGSWGGLGVGNARVAWFSPDDPNGRNGRLKMNALSGSGQEMRFRVLDGIGDDSFRVEVLNEAGDWVEVYNHTADPSTTEEWVEHKVTLTGYDLPLGGPMTIRFRATGPKWASWSTYGQLAIDWVELWGPGQPRNP